MHEVWYNAWHFADADEILNRKVGTSMENKKNMRGKPKICRGSISEKARPLPLADSTASSALRAPNDRGETIHS